MRPTTPGHDSAITRLPNYPITQFTDRSHASSSSHRAASWWHGARIDAYVAVAGWRVRAPRRRRHGASRGGGRHVPPGRVRAGGALRCRSRDSTRFCRSGRCRRRTSRRSSSRSPSPSTGGTRRSRPSARRRRPAFSTMTMTSFPASFSPSSRRASSSPWRTFRVGLEQRQHYDHPNR